MPHRALSQRRVKGSLLLFVCTLLNLTAAQLEILGWTIASKTPNYTELGEAEPAVLGAVPVQCQQHPLEKCRASKRPEMPVPANICACLLYSQWSAETTQAHLTDRQQREPEGLGQISVIYATKPFNVLR